MGMPNFCSSSTMETLGWIVSATLLVKVVCNIVHFIYTAFLGSWLGHSLDLRKSGSCWAVVTGATDGIGKAFAKKMAEAGLNVVLISRSPAKLKTVADEFRSQYGSVQIKTIAADFTDGHSIYCKIRTELSGLAIGVLVNNVGMTPNPGDKFENYDEATILDTINCNVVSITRMTHLILPQMVQRKSGVIINIGSVCSAGPSPLFTLYGATKAFVDKFSLDLATEVRPVGVTVQSVLPSHANTNMVPKDHVPSTWLSTAEPDAFAAGTLRTLGLEDRTGGYWTHKMQLCLADTLNFFVPRRLMELNNLKLAKDYVTKRAHHLQQMEKAN